MKNLILASVSVFALAGAAHAATLEISGGTAGTIPDGQTNEVLEETFGLVSLDGFFGSNIDLNGSERILVEWIGFEAGFNNTFTFGGDGFDTEDEANDIAINAANAPDDMEYASAGGGLITLDSYFVDGLSDVRLDFVFATDGNGGHSVSNTGVNPDNSDADLVNFFAAYADDLKQSILLFFDDAGADDDDNHDDMVVRLTLAPAAVPVPAAGLLLLSALGGLGLARRRRKS